VGIGKGWVGWALDWQRIPFFLTTQQHLGFLGKMGCLFERGPQEAFFQPGLWGLGYFPDMEGNFSPQSWVDFRAQLVALKPHFFCGVKKGQ